MKPIWPWPTIAGLREPGTGIREQHLDVARARLAAVDAVGRAVAAADPARDLELARLGEAGQALRPPAQLEPHLGHVVRRARRRAVEDHVLHLVAAQALGRALAHGPAQRLDDVGLAAAVRADDAGQAGLELQLDRLGERLEAADAKSGYFQRRRRNMLGQARQPISRHAAALRNPGASAYLRAADR